MADADGWDDAADQALVAAVEARLERVIDAALARPIDPNALFDHRRASDDGRFAQQRADLAARVAAQQETERA
jgi:hypothetical protein